MKLARLAIWTLWRRRSKQQRIIDPVSQSNSGGNAALQMGYNACNIGHSIVAQGYISGGDQGYADYPIHAGNARNAIEVDYGKLYRGHLNIPVAHLQYATIQSVNNLGHPFTLGLKARFGRSIRAFVNAWRVG